MELLRRQRVDVSRRVVAEVMIFQHVHIGTLTPVVLTRFEHGAIAHHLFHELEGPGAVGADGEVAAFLGVEDGQRVMKQMLRHRELRGLGIQSNRVVVHLLDRIGVP